MDRQPLITLDRVSFSYDAERTVLRDVEFSLHDGERIGLTGSNGCGKTTVLHLIVGLIRPQRGDVVILGRVRRAERDFRDVRRRVGLVFQTVDDQLFCPTVLEDVMFGPLNLGLTRSEAHDRASDTLNRLALGALGDRLVHQLSGGEKRLVALATVLAMQPDVILLDEPTAGLDDLSSARLIDVLRSLPQSMLIATHDRNLLDAVATRTLRIVNGRLEIDREAPSATA